MRGGGTGSGPVAAALRERADRLRREAMAQFGGAPVLDPLPIEPAAYHDDHAHPDSVSAQLEQCAGVAGCVVVDDGRTALVQKGYDDGWENPGGALEPGESLAETAKRETEEETNLAVELTDLLYTRDLAFDYGGPERVRVPVAVFVAERVGGRRAVPRQYVSDGRPEIVDVRWFGPDELPADLRDRDRIRALLD